MAEVKRGDVVVGALGHRKALFGYSGHLPTAAAARRRRAAAEPGRRDRHLRLDQSVARRAVRLPRARLRARLPVSRRNASACPRASSTEPLEPRRAARDARRADRRDRGHLHELRQDRGGVRNREPLPAQRPRRRRVQVDRRRAAPRHPRDGRLGRAARRDVLRLRHLRDDLEERARAHAESAERARRREARRHRFRARRRPARRLRRRGDPARQGDRRA